MKIDRAIAMLKRDHKDCLTLDFAEQVIRLLMFGDLSKKALLLMQELVKKFGFAVARFFRPWYYKLTARHRGRFSKELSVIEEEVENCLAPYGFKYFSELDFIKQQSKRRNKQALPQGGQSICLSIDYEFTEIIKEVSLVEDSLTNGTRQFHNQTKFKFSQYLEAQYGQLQYLYNNRLSKRFHFQRKYFQERLDTIAEKLESLWPSTHRFSEEVAPLIKCLKAGAEGKDLVRISDNRDSVIMISSQPTKVLSQSFDDPPKSESIQDEYVGSIRVGVKEKLKKKNYRARSTTQSHKGDHGDFEDFRPSSITISNRTRLSRVTQSKEDIINRKVHLCCRTFFYANELIEEPESIIREYKKYRLPFSNYQIEKLKKTIVGFLNECGGVIYIGISESSNRIRKVVSSRISDKQKESVQTEMREKIFDVIEPDVIASRLVTVKFVPVKDPKSDRFLPGRYVIKIVVEMGHNRELYTYKGKDGQELAFRTDNEVIRMDLTKNVRRVLGIMRDRLEGVHPKPEVAHFGACPEPEVGEPVYCD